MKRSVRLVFSILIFVLFAATLSFRILVRRTLFASIELHRHNVILPRHVTAPIFNSIMGVKRKKKRMLLKRRPRF
ncbi:unnamed protein product [Linum trigynum]|uniref:Secreted protein n=1 Tax=Linum trigynum TaxID=586398 RepID=A0AAV2GL88_9ROSI